MLPFDLLILSFSFLAYRELSRASALVNHYFCSAVRQAFKIYVFELRVCSVDLEQGFDLLISKDLFVNCRKLTLSSSSLWSIEEAQRLLPCFPHLPHLSFLDLSWLSFADSEFWTVVFPSLQQLSLLTELNLSFSPVPVGIFARSLHYLSSLQSLDVSACHLGSISMHMLIPPLRLSFCSLTSLDLSRNNLRDAGAFSLSCALPHLLQLQHLCLSSTTIGSAGMFALASCFPLLLHLQSINLNFNPDIGDSGIVSFCTAISGSCLRSLRILNFRSIGMTHIGILSLIDCFQSFPCLEEMDFSSNNCGDQGVIALASALRLFSSSLRALFLVSTDISSIGASALASALPSLPHLLELDLYGNFVHISGFNSLLSVLSPPHSWICRLRYVNLLRNSIWVTSQRKKELDSMKDMPRFHISIFGRD